jgi:ATP-dependent helicase/nuclease subunit A
MAGVAAMTAGTTSNTLKATDPHSNASVHASAGTGKTWLLVTRIIRLLLAGAQPDSILAVTFTRKAAGEMEQRVMERLHELMCVEPGQLDKLLEQAGIAPETGVRHRARQLYEQLLFNPWQLRCTTFHAFCQELLQRFPLEAGIAPGFEIGESTGLLEQAARDALLAATIKQPDSPAARALDNLVEGCDSLHSAQSALRSFLAQRSDWWAWTQDAREPLSFANRKLAAFLAIDPGSDPLAGFPNDGQQARIAEYATLLQRNNTKPAAAAARSLGEALNAAVQPAAFLSAITPAFLTQAGTPRVLKESAAQRKRMGADAEQRMLALHAEVVAELLALIDARARHLSWHTTTAWYTAGSALLEHFQRLKREQRVLDFADLEWLACELLNRSEHASWVQYKLDARIDHLLVDEFQDTNPTQWHLLLPLLQELAAGNDERERSVFLVGDKKQSIYRFRRANAALLDEASDWLETDMQAQRYPLDASRRSAGAIMDCVNAVFSQPPLEERLADFKPHTTHLPDMFGLVELLPLQVDADNSDNDTTADTSPELRNPLLAPRIVEEDARYAAEGRMLAQQIQSLMSSQTPVLKDGTVRALNYGDIMILLRQRTHADAYETALRDAGIPCLAASKGLLLENLEVRDLVALLNILISPHDNLALAQVLRAPLFGLSSEQLIPLADNSEGRWYLQLGQLAGQGQSPYLEAHSRLEHWRTLAGRIPVHDLLDRIFHEGEVVQRYEAAFPAALLPRVRASLTRFIELALEIDNGRYPSLPRFLDQLRRLRQSDQDQPDESAPDDSSSERVRLLTIHGAKGLEAAVVFLADTAVSTRDRSAHSAVVDWPRDSDRPALMLLAANQATRDTATAALLEQQGSDSLREDANLLYVALTRARQYLFISGSGAEKNVDSSWYGMIRSAMQDCERNERDNPVYRSGTPLACLPGPAHEQHSVAVDPRLAQPLVLSAPQLHIAPSRHAATLQTADGDSDGRERGIAIHAMLDALTQADRPDPETLLLQLASTQQREPDDAEFLHWWQVALATVKDPQLSIVFDDSRYTQAFNEVPVQYLDDGRLVYGVIDRLVVTAETVMLVDYKTHAHADAASIPQLVEHYREQLRYYTRAVEQLWPQHKVRPCLLFTACAELVCLDGLQSATHDAR